MLLLNISNAAGGHKAKALIVPGGVQRLSPGSCRYLKVFQVIHASWEILLFEKWLNLPK